MRIVLLNPCVSYAGRRRHTTLVCLREHGQDVELLFTSLKALAALRDQAQEAITAMLEGREGSAWENPSIATRRRAYDEASDLLYDAGLLERPEFMRRPVVQRIVRRAPARPSGAAGDPPAGQ